MLNRGVFSQIHGVISTGKEANVYAATSPDGADRAIKVCSRPSCSALPGQQHAGLQ
jgi:serine/threonine-protein kinase RIO1